MSKILVEYDRGYDCNTVVIRPPLDDAQIAQLEAEGVFAMLEPADSDEHLADYIRRQREHPHPRTQIAGKGPETRIEVALEPAYESYASYRGVAVGELAIEELVTVQTAFDSHTLNFFSSMSNSLRSV